ncbi:winged helix-turn-helix domain-containing protein [Eudoraea adriatica]|uniref:winged helix-turn-helix domain-containing protein n=1 Tax=Eudoraea adriatica TaxID=446681 RepID=UPI00037950A2|nr:winged helix-turn-helix domain-containing protein [Eudoraea adriatica]
MTSWSNKELEQLIDPNNHKIKFDGFDYVWYHKINGKWEIHSIEIYDNYEKPYSYLRFWLYEWNKELTSRRRTEMRKKLSIEKKVWRICEVLEYDTYKRVLEIHKLDPTLTHKEIADMLNVSKQLVGRYIKDAA